MLKTRSIFGLGASLSTLGVIVACSQDRTYADFPGYTEADSAGVLVIRNSQPERGLQLSEALRVGVVEGDPDHQFARIRSIGLNGTGGFWVVDSHEQIRHYGPDGDLAGEVGGAGQGPGEAQGYGSVWIGGESVLAWGFPGILQEFAPDGSLLASRTPRTGDGATLYPLGYSGGQWILTLRSFEFDGSGPARRIVVPIGVEGLEAQTWDTLGRFPGELYVPLPNDHAGRASYFIGNPSYAVDAAGGLYASDTLAYRIERYTATGLDRIIMRQAHPTPYQESWADDIEEGIRSALERPDEDAVDRLLVQALPPSPPPHIPITGRLLVSSDGAIWVERVDRHPRPPMAAVAHAFGYARHAWKPEWAAPQVFDVYHPGGRYRGTVQLPSTFAPMAVTSDKVYGVSYDDLGVEYVVGLQIEGPQGAPSGT